MSCVKRFARHATGPRSGVREAASPNALCSHVRPVGTVTMTMSLASLVTLGGAGQR